MDAAILQPARVINKPLDIAMELFDRYQCFLILNGGTEYKIEIIAKIINIIRNCVFTKIPNKRLIIYNIIEKNIALFRDISPFGKGRKGLEISSVFISQTWLMEFDAPFKHITDNTAINVDMIGGIP